MSNPNSFSTAEPVVAGAGVSAAILGVTGAVIQLAQSFGVNITASQSTAGMAFVGAVSVLVAAFRSRRAVSPVGAPSGDAGGV